MKKALIAILILAVAGGLFAQVSVGGSATTGLEVAIEDDTTFHLYNHRDYGGMYKFELSGSYTTENGKAGGDGGLDVTDGNIGGWGASVWFKPLDILKVTAGSVSTWDFGTPGSLGAHNGNSDDGVILFLDPMAGLNLFAGVYPSGGEFGDTAFGVGAKFVSSGLFQIVANLGYDGAGNNGDGSVNAGAGVDVLALSGLGLTKLAVDVSVGNLTKLSDAGTVSVGPRINYKFGDFSGYVRANLGIPVLEGDELNFRAGVRGQYPVSSAINAILDAGYTLKGAVTNTNGSPFDFRAGWSGLPGGAPSATETSVVGIQPAVTFNIDGKTLELGYGFFTQLGDISKSKSAIYTNFVVGF